MSHRRHDIDALRALAFALVIVYHVGMYYVADWHWHLKSPDPVAWLQAPMRALNLWRLDLVFLISGLSVGLLCHGARQGQGAGTLLKQRSRLLLLPLVFGMAVVVPYQPYAQAVANGSIAPGFMDFLLRYVQGGPWPTRAFDGSEVGVTWNHLWYLAYLWFYTLVLILLLPWLRSGPGLTLARAFRGLRGQRLMVLPVLPLLLYTGLLWPRFPVTHDLLHDAWAHAVYFTLFLYGYWIGVDADWWAEARRLRGHLLAGALLMLVVYFVLRAQLSPVASPFVRFAVRIVADVYLWWMVLAILGWAHHLLNRPWPWLPWANEQVYPWYVLHQTFIVVLIVQLAPLRLAPALEAVLLLVTTLVACASLTVLIRRVHGLRLCFGLRPRTTPTPPTPQPPLPGLSSSS
jgi:peptidoglycan/LPS O-acetylase OafA/YrhL